MPRPRRWTDQQLAHAVAASKTLAEVCRRIGIQPGRYDLLRAHITRVGADTAHLRKAGPRAARRRRWTDDALRAAVADASTVSDVQRALGYRVSGGTHGLITRHIQRLGLDTSHFLGRASTRGRKMPGRQKIQKPVPTVRTTCKLVSLSGCPCERWPIMSTSDPLFPPTALLPQSDPGGVRQIPARPPGPLRPFAATLAVPLSIDAKKHDTIATRSSHKTPESTINDGTSSDDSVTDTDVDD